MRLREPRVMAKASGAEPDGQVVERRGTHTTPMYPYLIGTDPQNMRASHSAFPAAGSSSCADRAGQHHRFLTYEVLPGPRVTSPGAWPDLEDNIAGRVEPSR